MSRLEYLWSWPLPMDYNDDGLMDLVIATAYVAGNGTWYFENTGRIDSSNGCRSSSHPYVLVSSPHPKRRDPLVISISDDRLVFHTMAYLAGGRHVDYPHVIEHGDSLYVAFATIKQTAEVLKIRRSDLASIRNTSKEQAGAGGSAQRF